VRTAEFRGAHTPCVVSASDAESFRRPADAYDRFVGRYGASLGRELIAFAGIRPDARCLDVGCGPGALTGALAEVVGAERVAAVEPSEPFAAACSARFPDVDVRVAGAEALPFEDGVFDAVASQLVLNFVPEPGRALAEMRRVARAGGLVAACVWDYRDGMTLLRAFWDAAVALDPEAASLDEGRRMRPGSAGELAELWEAAGLGEVETAELVARAEYDGFDDLWSPLPRGVGPAGAYCSSLDGEGQRALHDELWDRLGGPDGPFELTARAWAVRGRVTSGS
jgi:SAM-dependent methyltransferase